MTNPEPAERHNTGLVLLDRSTTRAGPRPEYACQFISPGRVMKSDGTESNLLIPAATLIDAAPLFGSVSSFLDHPSFFGFGWRQTPQVKDLVGVTANARWSADDEAVVGNIRLYADQEGSPGAFIRALLDQVLEDKGKGLEVPQLGLSAVFYSQSHLDEATGLRVFDEIRYVESVDFVYSPGARGYVRAALDSSGAGRLWPALEIGGGPSTGSGRDASTGSGRDASTGSGQVPLPQHGGVEMTDQPTSGGIDGNSPSQDEPIELKDALALIQDLAQEVRQARDVVPEEPEADPVQELGRRLADVELGVSMLTRMAADEARAETVQDMGQPTLLFGGENGLQRLEVALDHLMAGTRPPEGIEPLSGIRELYTLLSGDWSMTGRFHPDRVYLAAVTVATMANLCANALNKVVVNAFQEYPRWWGNTATEVDFSSLHDAKWISLGDVGELPTVSEGAQYTELTWDDFAESDAFVKKGGYLGLTLEAIDKDDTARIMAAPRKLAQAAWLTLGKAIAAVHTDNSGYGATMSDSNYLYDSSNHSNQGSSALTYANFVATRTAMMKFTAINSDERLGAATRPRYLWVPIDLEMTALQVLASDGEPGTADNDVNPLAQGNLREERLRRAAERVITVPFWTDTADWVAQADPNLYPGYGIGYRFGRTPEIFSVASPTAGLMFSNDTLPVKVRFFFAVGPTDWRAWYKNLVS